MAILLKEKINHTIINIHKSEDGRRLIINVTIQGSNYCLVCAYAPNEGKVRIDFLKRLQKWVKQKCCDEDKVIMGADLNTVDNIKDRSTGNLDQSSSISQK